MKRYILICLMSAVFYACPNKYTHEDCDASYYTFNFSVNFEPSDEIIQFGDTITVRSTFQRNLIPVESGEIFDFDSIDIRPIVSFTKLDTPYFDNFLLYPYTDFFDFFVDSIYNLRVSGNSIGFDYDYSGDDYTVEFKFIPNRKGIYHFQFGSAYLSPSQYENIPILNAVDFSCKTNKWSPYFNTNGDNNHKELLKESIYDYYSEGAYDKWSQSVNLYGRHCFKVE